MLRTRGVFVKGTDPKKAKETEYFSRMCGLYGRLTAEAFRYVEATRSGLAKKPEERTDEENEILSAVFEGLEKANAKRAAKDKKPFEIPDKENSLLMYNHLDAVLKETENETYRALPAQVSQTALRKTAEAWLSYCRAAKGYSENPDSYSGRPKSPKRPSGDEETACFTNQSARLRKIGDRTYVSFPKSDVTVEVGALEGRLVKTEVKPTAGGYEILVTTETADPEPTVPENPKRIMGIDFGVGNLMAVANNCGLVPFLVKGEPIKAMNQWSCKRGAKLESELSKGDGSGKGSKALNAIRRKRSDVLSDYFYKASHLVCRRAAEAGIEVIVVGRNRGWKSGINLGRANNQTICMIPYEKLLRALRSTASKYGIPVIEVEESYTSKASALDMDFLPEYGKTDGGAEFSGERKKRGLYVSGEGKKINADVNGAANIIRKAFPNAFDETEDLSFLYETTETVGRNDLYEKPSSEKSGTPKRRHQAGPASRAAHRKKWSRKIGFMETFDAGRKFRSAEERTARGADEAKAS